MTLNKINKKNLSKSRMTKKYKVVHLPHLSCYLQILRNLWRLSSESSWFLWRWRGWTNTRNWRRLCFLRVNFGNWSEINLKVNYRSFKMNNKHQEKLILQKVNLLLLKYLEKGVFSSQQEWLHQIKQMQEMEAWLLAHLSKKEINSKNQHHNKTSQ
jgi:hypothetical protein